MSELDQILRTEVFSASPYIFGEAEILHFDRYPVLYSGFNLFGSRVIGSLVEETDNGDLRYIHFFVETNHYDQFISRKLTYRELVSRAETIYIIQTRMPLKKGRAWEVRVGELPNDYWPLEGSFCPPSAAINSLEYGFHLDGGYAKRHLARIGDIESLVHEASMLLKAPFGLLKGYLNPEVFLRALAPASFDVQFVVEFEGEQLDLLASGETITPYINDFLDVSANYLSPAKIDELGKSDFRDKRINALVGKLDKWAEAAGVEGLKVEPTALLDSFRESIGHIETIITLAGDGFEVIDFEQRNLNEKKRLKSLSSANRDDFVERLKKIDKLLGDNIRDSRPSKFKVLVYALNRESLSAKAHVIDPVDTKMTRARLEILAPNQEKIDRLAESLRFKKLITARGFAIRRRGEIAALEIDELQD